MMYFSMNAMKKNLWKEREFTVCCVNWFSMRIVCAFLSFLKSIVVIFKTLRSKTIPLRCTRTEDRLYKEVLPLHPEKKIPNACRRVKKSRKSESIISKTYEMLKQSNKYSKYEKIWQPFWDRVSNGLNIGSKPIYLTQSFSMNRLSRILSSK